MPSCLRVIACVLLSSSLCGIACSSSPEVADAGAGSKHQDAGDDPTDASQSNDPDDGTPVRKTCTDDYGDQMTAEYGRIDGTIVAIVPSNYKGCRGSDTHVSLQIMMNGAMYNAALNIDGLETSLVHAAVGAAWQEGWHPGGSLDYIDDLQVHSTSFKKTDEAELESLLADANHVSVWETGYASLGGHLVHRTRASKGTDGALVLQPLSAAPTYVLFRFDDQSF
jgi:hypothetical protein